MSFAVWRNKFAAKALVIHAIFSFLAIVAVMHGVYVMAHTGRYEPEQMVMGILIAGGLLLIYPLAAIAVVLSLFSWSTVGLLLLMFVFLTGVTERSVILTLLYPLATLGVLIWRARQKKRVLAR